MKNKIVAIILSLFFLLVIVYIFGLKREKTNQTNIPQRTLKIINETKSTIKITQEERTSTPIKVPTIIYKDNTPPLIYILEPQNNAKVKRGLVKIVANVTDNDRVDRVEFFIGPENTPIAILYNPPYEYNWDLNEKYINARNIPIQVKAFDKSGNSDYKILTVDPEQ